MMQKDLLVTVTPAVVKANFEDIKNYLTIEVEKYDVVVTADTVKDAKKLATELNAVTKQINEVKKAHLPELEAPAKAFKEQIAELNGIVQGGRGKILSQVQRFEEKTLEDITDLVRDLLLEEYEINGLENEYRNVTYTDLVLLGSMTATGKLTGKVKGEIRSRVMAAKYLQDAVEKRLLQLENECYKAGLRVPISAEYIKDFLKSPEIEYRNRLENLIRIELDRQAEADKKAQAKHDEELQHEREKREQAERQAEELREQPLKLSGEQRVIPIEKEPQKPSIEAVEGKKVVGISIQFDVLVREGAQKEKVALKMRELLEAAGITNLNKIEVIEYE